MAAKVRCRSCYGDHDYRREVVPPTKKELKIAADALAAGMALDSGAAPEPETPPVEKPAKKPKA
ncbi:MAG: hypothetical protein ABI995_11810 [Acidobacteriota bacterium]